MRMPLLLSLLLVLVLSSCADDTVVPGFHEKRAQLVDHDWKIGFLSVDAADDEAAEFDRITLDFGEQNSVVAVSTNGQSFYGTWTISRLETGGEQLRIQFTGSDLLSRLNRNWKIENFKVDKIELLAEQMDQETGASRLHLIKK